MPTAFPATPRPIRPQKGQPGFPGYRAPGCSGRAAPGLMPLVPAGSLPSPAEIRDPHYRLCGLAPAPRPPRCPSWCCTASSGRPRSAPPSGSCPSPRRGRLWPSPRCRGPAGPRCTSAEDTGQAQSRERLAEAPCEVHPSPHTPCHAHLLAQGQVWDGQGPRAPRMCIPGMLLCRQPHGHHPGPMPSMAGTDLGESHIGESVHGKGGLGAQLPLLLPL